MTQSQILKTGTEGRKVLANKTEAEMLAYGVGVGFVVNSLNEDNGTNEIIILNTTGPDGHARLYIASENDDDGFPFSQMIFDCDSGFYTIVGSTEFQIAQNGIYINGDPIGNAATKNVGTTAGTVAAGDDSRLSNARTPTSHTHPFSAITTRPTTLSGYGITDAKLWKHEVAGVGDVLSTQANVFDVETYEIPPDDCGDFTDQTACEELAPDCAWVGPYDCVIDGAGSEGICTGFNAACVWTPYYCEDIYDETECNSVGCTWDGVNCYGGEYGGECNGYIPEACEGEYGGSVGDTVFLPIAPNGQFAFIRNIGSFPLIVDTFDLGVAGTVPNGIVWLFLRTDSGWVRIPI